MASILGKQNFIKGLFLIRNRQVATRNL